LVTYINSILVFIPPTLAQLALCNRRFAATGENDCDGRRKMPILDGLPVAWRVE
jgi:hypothetical protein